MSLPFFLADYLATLLTGISANAHATINPLRGDGYSSFPKNHRIMTISAQVQRQLIDPHTDRLICLPVRTADIVLTPERDQSSVSKRGVIWSKDEHDRFLLGLELFPAGPWKAIARVVGTRTARQTMSHGQKYRLKIHRHKRGLFTSRGTLREDTTNNKRKTKKRLPDPASDDGLEPLLCDDELFVVSPIILDELEMCINLHSFLSENI